MKYQQYIIKRKIENVFIYPFVLIGRIFATIQPLKQEYSVFFFFPFYHTGGAEKVHALITQSFKNSNGIIFFTRKSVDATFYHEFEKSGYTIKNISIFTDNKWLYFLNLIYRGIITGYINHQENKPIVFNGQCNFGYKISPWIYKDIKQIELIHSFNTFSWIRIPFMEFIEKTIMISKVRIDNHLQQYQQIHVPAHFNNRIQYIANGIDLPTNKFEKDYTKTLQILYVGRGTSEKRVHLVAAIAKKVKEHNSAINFTIVGDVENAIPNNLLPYCTLSGNIYNADELSAIYQQAHILLITSNTEGFPMVVMEAMANGCAIIGTPVGDLPVHIKNKINGFITVSINEEIVIEEMSQQILALESNKEMLQQMSLQNQVYAKDNFDIALFNHNYQELFTT